MSSQSARAVLIVDDDQSVVDTFTYLLRLEGFTVYAALNPEVGLEIAADKPLDAIVLDFCMPGLSGLQILQRLRKAPSTEHTPVAVVTGDHNIDDGTTSQLEALGASVRFKPFWMDDVVAFVRELMDGSGGGREVAPTGRWHQP